jgi:hypothetical protein
MDFELLSQKIREIKVQKCLNRKKAYVFGTKKTVHVRLDKYARILHPTYSYTGYIENYTLVGVGAPVLSFY